MIMEADGLALRVDPSRLLAWHGDTLGLWSPSFVVLACDYDHKGLI